MSDNDLTLIKQAIQLINKGMAENAFDGIAVPYLPEHTLIGLRTVVVRETTVKILKRRDREINGV